MRGLDSKAVVRLIAVGGVLLVAGACRSKPHLNRLDFADRTLSLEYLDPPSPQLLHGLYDLRVSDDVVQTVVLAGGGVAKEVVARRAIARLDSASTKVDVANRLALRTLERATRYLGTRPVVQGQGDLVLEITMKSFGLDARKSTAAYVFTNAEAVLLERKTGRELWSVRVHGNQRMTPWAHGTEVIPSSIITAGTLATVSVDDFAQALDQLVTYTSDLITNELRAVLRNSP